jgi:hypothetical protein
VLIVSDEPISTETDSGSEVRGVNRTQPILRPERRGELGSCPVDWPKIDAR